MLPLNSLIRFFACVLCVYALSVFTGPVLIISSILFTAIVFVLSHSQKNSNPRAVPLLFGEQSPAEIALGASVISLVIGVLFCYGFDKSDLGFQLVERVDISSVANLSFTTGVDGLSMIFILLTLFIFPILFVTIWYTAKGPALLVHLLLLELLIILSFGTLDLLYFFIFFEGLLIPMFIVIGQFGGRERKIKAAYYFFLYTLFGSLFMFFSIMYLYCVIGTTNLFVLLNTSLLDLAQQQVIWLCFFLAFAVKMPLFPFHIWLPEAHVEAPTVGSMLLASLLLKLGGYGFLRFSLTFLNEGGEIFKPLVCLCSILGVVYGSLATLRQIDLKRIIAYSSVAHMNLVMLGLFSGSEQGVEGAVYLMVAHGVVSTALFFCVGVLYDRHHTRLLRYYGGLVTTMPWFAVAFLLFSLANMSFPGTSNFLGEFLIFLGVFERNSVVLLLSTAGIVLSAAYSVWLYNRAIFGTVKTQYTTHFSDLTYREAVILAALLVPMLALGLTSDFILSFVQNNNY